MLLLVNISFYYSENQLQSCGPEHLDNFIIVKENGNALGKIAYDFFSPHVWRLFKNYGVQKNANLQGGNFENSYYYWTYTVKYIDMMCLKHKKKHGK